ncbi:hypothetical protein GCM10009559_42760 [Pseudonocardia zijingensis]|uniref:Uncharacterized protein n=1 Tax=Pseudonocardia zijingensis TaxID=153376 RepID=A0ABP4B275_9PSEU
MSRVSSCTPPPGVSCAALAIGAIPVSVLPSPVAISRTTCRSRVFFSAKRSGRTPEISRPAAACTGRSSLPSVIRMTSLTSANSSTVPSSPAFARSSWALKTTSPPSRILLTSRTNFVTGLRNPVRVIQPHFATASCAASFAVSAVRSRARSASS